MACWSGTWKEQDWKISFFQEREVCRSMYVNLSPCHTMWTHLCPKYTHYREALNTQVVKIICIRDVSRPPSQSPHCLFMDPWQSGQSSRVGGYIEAQQYGLPLTKTDPSTASVQCPASTPKTKTELHYGTILQEDQTATWGKNRPHKCQICLPCLKCFCQNNHSWL